MKKYPAIIAYDIVSNKRRRRLHRCLQGWGLAAQYSVFECRLALRPAEELFLQLTELINPQEDKLILIWLDQRREATTLTKGPAPLFNESTRYLG